MNLLYWYRIVLDTTLPPVCTWVNISHFFLLWFGFCHLFVGSLWPKFYSALSLSQENIGVSVRFDGDSYLNFVLMLIRMDPENSCYNTKLLWKGNNALPPECIAYEPERPFLHLTDCCWFLISSGWGGGRWGFGGGEARGPSWRGRIKGVQEWRGFNLCVRLIGGALAVW